MSPFCILRIDAIGKIGGTDFPRRKKISHRFSFRCGALPPAPERNSVGFFSLSAFGGDAKGRLRQWVGRTSVKGKGFAGDPRSVASGTLYRSLQPRIPSRDLSEECCRLPQRFALLRFFGLSGFFRKGVDFSRFCAIIKVRGNTGDGCYLRLVKITASVWKLRAVISFCFECRLQT